MALFLFLPLFLAPLPFSAPALRERALSNPLSLFPLPPPPGISPGDTYKGIRRKPSGGIHGDLSIRSTGMDEQVGRGEREGGKEGGGKEGERGREEGRKAVCLPSLFLPPFSLPWFV